MDAQDGGQRADISIVLFHCIIFCAPDGDDLMAAEIERLSPAVGMEGPCSEAGDLPVHDDERPNFYLVRDLVGGEPEPQHIFARRDRRPVACGRTLYMDHESRRLCIYQRAYVGIVQMEADLPIHFGEARLHFYLGGERRADVVVPIVVQDRIG